MQQHFLFALLEALFWWAVGVFDINEIVSERFIMVVVSAILAYVVYRKNIHTVVGKGWQKLPPLLQVLTPPFIISITIIFGIPAGICSQNCDNQNWIIRSCKRRSIQLKHETDITTEYFRSCLKLNQLDWETCSDGKTCYFF